jgi:hypothetical protein
MTVATHSDTGGAVVDSILSEKAFYKQTLIWIGFLLLSCFVFLALITLHPQLTWMILAVATIGIALLSIILVMFCWMNQSMAAREQVSDGTIALTTEEASLQFHNQLDRDDTSSFSCSFEATPDEVRNSAASLPSKEPRSGIYELVYSALYFNKTVRSQGELNLHFHTKRNGWEITGTQEFHKSKKRSSLIDKGFLNGHGQLYWESGGTMYRGIFDFEKSAMYEGEFKATGSGSGRIVRLAFLIRPVDNADVEMTDLRQAGTIQIL